MAHFQLEVKTYSGYRADERPTEFRLGERWLRVQEVVDRWLGEDHAYFKVEADDGMIYVLRHDLERDAWELVLMEPPGAGSVTATKGEA